VEILTLQGEDSGL
jgi:hypothetical protein